MAIQYKITSVSRAEDTLTTIVEYTFTAPDVQNTTTVSVAVAHFQPPDVDTVTLGIENRAQSELRKIQAQETLAELAQEIHPSDSPITL